MHPFETLRKVSTIKIEKCFTTEFHKVHYRVLKSISQSSTEYITEFHRVYHRVPRSIPQREFDGVYYRVPQSLLQLSPKHFNGSNPGGVTYL